MVFAECTNGTYGNGCKNNCSTTCSVSNHCNITTGECLGGCQPGWKGFLCEQSKMFNFCFFSQFWTICPCEWKWIIEKQIVHSVRADHWYPNIRFLSVVVSATQIFVKNIRDSIAPRYIHKMSYCIILDPKHGYLVNLWRRWLFLGATFSEYFF